MKKDYLTLEFQVSSLSMKCELDDFRLKYTKSNHPADNFKISILSVK